MWVDSRNIRCQVRRMIRRPAKAYCCATILVVTMKIRVIVEGILADCSLEPKIRSAHRFKNIMCVHCGWLQVAKSRVTCITIWPPPLAFRLGQVSTILFAMRDPLISLLIMFKAPPAYTLDFTRLRTFATGSQR